MLREFFQERFVSNSQNLFDKMTELKQNTDLTD